MPVDKRTNAEKLELLLHHAPFFSGLSDEQISSLAKLMKFGTSRKGDYLYKEGDDGHSMYVLVRGRVKVTRNSRDGREQFFQLAGPGDYLGELSVFDPGPRATNAMVVEPADHFELPSELLNGWIDENPSSVRWFLRAMAQRQRSFGVMLADVVHTDVPGRVAKAILLLAHKFGEVHNNSMIVRHGLTQEELAHFVGATRETVNKALSDFISRGWITTRVGVVEILDMNRLKGRIR